jgi:hypothetical protein
MACRQARAPSQISVGNATAEHEVRKMDIFLFIETEQQRIEQQLDEFIASYHQMTNEKRFERASLIVDEIRRHLEHEKTFVSRISNENKDTKFLNECLKNKEEIMDAMDFLLMSHVDDVDFREGLRKLLERFDAHLEHYNDKLFVAFRQQLSSQELASMNSQATDWMLGSEFGSRF